MDVKTLQQFPSDGFMGTHFGWNYPLLVRLDTGLTISSKHGELRREMQYATLHWPHHLIKTADRSSDGTRECCVFRDHSLTDWASTALAQQFGVSIMSPEFQSDLYRELAALVTTHQPYTADWWEWFASDGLLGARFKEHAMAGGNAPKRTLAALLRNAPE